MLSLNQFLWGALAMAAATAGTFFLKFWKQTGDRLFGAFAAAFFALSLNWIVLAVVQPDYESRHYAYFIRLIAFVLIIAGVIDKNRNTN